MLIGTAGRNIGIGIIRWATARYIPFRWMNTLESLIEASGLSIAAVYGNFEGGIAPAPPVDRISVGSNFGADEIPLSGKLFGFTWQSTVNEPTQTTLSGTLTKEFLSEMLLPLQRRVFDAIPTYGLRFALAPLEGANASFVGAVDVPSALPTKITLTYQRDNPFANYSLTYWTPFAFFHTMDIFPEAALVKTGGTPITARDITISLQHSVIQQNALVPTTIELNINQRIGNVYTFPSLADIPLWEPIDESMKEIIEDNAALPQVVLEGKTDISLTVSFPVIYFLGVGGSSLPQLSQLRKDEFPCSIYFRLTSNTMRIDTNIIVQNIGLEADPNNTILLRLTGFLQRPVVSFS